MNSKNDRKPGPVAGKVVMPKRKRVKVSAGQVIAIPLCDGSYALAHIARYSLSIWCVLFDCRASDLAGLLEAVDNGLASRPIAVMQVTSDMVRDGHWPVIALRDPVYSEAMLDTRGHSSVAMITQMLFEAYYGLRPWDDGWDPKDYEKRLLPGVPVPPTVRYKRDFEKDAAAEAASTAQAGPEPPVTDGPAEIHIEIKYAGDGLPSIDLLHRRQALERSLEETGAGEVTDAGGGGGVMDVYLRTRDIRRAMPLVEAAVKTAGFEKDATIEASVLSDAEDEDA